MQTLKVHESILVGYFCQAIGWIARDLDVRKHPKDTTEQRMMRALNLSHNPLDPAIGDLILQLDNSGELPKEFYIFEFKVDWKKGIVDERTKFRVKNRDRDLTEETVEKISAHFPEVRGAHFYGALVPTAGKQKTLCVAPYWDALLGRHPHKVPSAMSLLLTIASNSSSRGMTLERLSKYMQLLNSSAASGTLASTGSVRFAVAYDDYQLYSFSLNSILEYQLLKEQRLEQLRFEQQESRNRPEQEHKSEQDWPSP